MIGRPLGFFWTMLALSFGNSSALAQGDPASGEEIYQRECAACHSLEEGVNQVGPTLHNVIGRQAGSLESYNAYSQALQQSDVVWTAETLDPWIEAPQDYIPGNQMPYPGLQDAQARQDVIAYLEQQSQSQGQGQQGQSQEQSRQRAEQQGQGQAQQPTQQEDASTAQRPQQQSQQQTQGTTPPDQRTAASSSVQAARDALLRARDALVEIEQALNRIVEAEQQQPTAQGPANDRQSGPVDQADGASGQPQAAAAATEGAAATGGAPDTQAESGNAVTGIEQDPSTDGDALIGSGTATIE